MLCLCVWKWTFHASRNLIERRRHHHSIVLFHMTCFSTIACDVPIELHMINDITNTHAVMRLACFIHVKIQLVFAGKGDTTKTYFEEAPRLWQLKTNTTIGQINNKLNLKSIQGRVMIMKRNRGERHANERIILFILLLDLFVFKKIIMIKTKS